MKRKQTFIVLLLMLFGMTLSAQDKSHFGLYFGMSVNNMNLDKSLFYDDTRLFANNEGAYYKTVEETPAKDDAELMFGGFYNYDINKYFVLQIDLFYCQYGYRIDGIVDWGFPVRCAATTQMHNINTALMLMVKPVKFVSVDLGVQPSYCWKMTKVTNVGQDTFRHVYSRNDEYKPFNFCAKGGLTLYLKSIFVSAHYALGLVDLLKVKTPYVDQVNGTTVFKYTSAESKTSSIQITIGYRIK